MAESNRVLAIDFGEKRIGLAISDPFAIISTGLGTIPNDSQTVQSLLKIIADYEVKKVIVGLPYTMKGEEGASAAAVRKFIGLLESSGCPPIQAVDERFTSVMAADTIRQLGVGKRKKEKNKGKIDEIAAVHLLQDYLRSTPSGF